MGCGKPATPRYGSLGGDSYLFKNSVTFACNQGYQLHGASSATCLANGTWSHSPPTCRSGSAVDRSLHPADSVLALDMIFVMDTSGSVGLSDFNSIKSFVHKMAKEFVISRDSTNMGAIAFGTSVYVISELSSSRTAFLDSVSNFQYKSGMAITTAALLKADSMFTSSTRSGSRLKRVLILITDGRSNSHPRRPEEVVPQLASHSVERFAFGVGNAYQPEINAIASPPTDAHVFNVTDFSVFHEFADAIIPSTQV